MAHLPQRRRSGCAAVLVPDPAGALAATPCRRPPASSGMHSRAEQRGSRSGDAMPGHDVAADALAATSGGGAKSHSAGDVDAEAARARRRAPTRRAGAGCRWARGRCRASARPAAGTPATAAACARAVALAGDAARDTCSRPRRGRRAISSTQPHQAGQDVERLEAGDHHRQPVPRDEGLEDAPAGDGRGVAGGEEALDAGLRHLGHDLHHRRDVLVRREHREVRRRAARGSPPRSRPRWSRSRWRRTPAPRRLRAPARPPARRCRRRRRARPRACASASDARGAGHAQHVAVGGDADALRARAPRASSTSGTSVTQTGQPGPMITSSARGKRRAQAEARDRLLVAAADVHHRDRRAADLADQRVERADQEPRARSGSRNLSWRGGARLSGASSTLLRAARDLAAHVGGHQIVLARPPRAAPRRARASRAISLGGNAADREADVVEHVVAGRDRLVDDVEAHRALRTPQKSTTASSPSTAITRPGTPRHMRHASSLETRASATSAWPSAMPPSPGGTCARAAGRGDPARAGASSPRRGARSGSSRR